MLDKGDTIVPQAHPELGQWVSNQMANKSKGILSDDRIRLLEEIGFEWDLLEKAWQEGYQKLKQFIDLNGHAKVPQKHPELGIWVASQRKLKDAKRGKLSQEWIELLDKIGFIWNLNDYEWKENFDLFKKHVNENGTAHIPVSDSILGGWVRAQRRARSSGKLSQDRIQVLDDAGFIWNAQGD